MDVPVLDLNQKLDLLTEQVAYLTEQARRNEQMRESGEELVESAMPVVREAMRLANDQLEEVQDYIQPADLLRMLKKLIVHGPQLEQLLDQLDSLSDLMDSVGPVAKLGMSSATTLLDGLDRKGYFELARRSGRMLDTVVTSLDEQDLDRLEQNIPPLMETVKDAAKPETVQFLQRTFTAVEEEVQKPVDSSMGGLLRQLRDPDVRRGLALSLRILQVIGRQAKDKKQ